MVNTICGTPDSILRLCVPVKLGSLKLLIAGPVTRMSARSPLFKINLSLIYFSCKFVLKSDRRTKHVKYSIATKADSWDVCLEIKCYCEKI